ncbi:TagH ABC-type polysaccharide/polyol phosphate transport system, ATPase component [Candidatus Nanopelagicaceae bacterium]
MAIIEVKNLNLTYRVLMTRTGSLKELFRDAVKGRVRINNYVALDGVNFSVDKGEVVAILGRNGAGKSTLLKVLAKVLPPTEGSLQINGTIAPLIELGAGFHPELTGTENVVFYSTLLGRDLKKTRANVAEIGEWAGVTDHMDFPLRTFSSGMMARLAFAAATYEKSDILLVDEILAVGDASFQAKSRKRMLELIEGGAAVILVSHDMGTVRTLATRAIWLEAGKVKMAGDPEEVVSAYEKSF